MKDSSSNLEEVMVVQGQLAAEIIKSHLESEGIPALLRYESAGPVFGLIIDGIGKVRIMVPQELAEEARKMIEPQEIEGNPE